MARMDAGSHDRRFIVRALSVAVVCGVLAAGANALQPVGKPQGPFGQGRPFSGTEAQAGGVASEPRLAELPPSPVADQGTGLSPPGSAPAAPTQGPFGDQGSAVGRGGPAEAGPPQGPLPPPLPDGGPGPMGGQNPMMEGGPPGQSPVFQGGGRTGPGAGPGSPPGAGATRP
jgi:hypothetical protein